MAKLLRWFILCAIMLGVSFSAQGKINPEEKFAERLLTSFTVTEFEGKNITLLEACNKLNDLFVRHQKDIGTAKFALYTIYVDKNHRIAKLNIFLHVKHVTLKAILDILCGQNYLIHIFEGGKIKFVSPIEE